MKYYAVQKGLTPGIYTDWNKCRAQVNGVPGAVFKSFGTLAEAEEFLSKNGYDPNPKKKANKNYPQINIRDYNCPIAFVDGSFNEKTNEYGYGIVIIEDTKNPKEIRLNGKADDMRYLETRNIAGEILAAQTVITYAINKGYSNLIIFHDYEGIGKWATDEWIAKQDISKDYKSFCKSIKDKINLQFVHVKGHSNNYYNDLVDALAKDALGITLEKKKFETIIHPENNITENNIIEDDITFV